MNEKASDTSFNPNQFFTMSNNSMIDLPSKAGSEEFLGSKHIDTSLSLKSFLNEGGTPLGPINTVINKRLDLQTQIDITPAYQTVYLPPKTVTVDNLLISKPIVFKGSSPLSLLVVNGSIRISLETLMEEGLNFKKLGVQSPRLAFVSYFSFRPKVKMGKIALVSLLTKKTQRRILYL